MFCKDDEPCTIKSVVIYNEPVITCVPIKVLLPVVAPLPSIVVILPPKPLVVVATDELNEPTLDEAEDVYELKDELNVYEGANDAVSADAIEPDMFIPPVAVILPVTTMLPSDTKPFFILNSLAIFSALVHFPQGGFLNKYFYINLTNDLTDH
jgi:hypothetical protein